MKRQPISTRLQRSIVLSSALGIVVVSLIVAAVSLVPLYQHLREEAQGSLAMAVDMRATSIEEYRTRIQNVAAQVSSRTAARQMLEAYNKGEIDLEELIALNTPKLHDALMTSPDMSSVLHLDHEENVVIALGLSVPEEVWSNLERDRTTVRVYDPVEIGARSFLIVNAPIRSETGYIGSNIVLFDMEHLYEIVQDTNELAASSRAFLGSMREDGIHILYAGGSNDQAPDGSMRETLNTVLQSTTLQQGGFFAPANQPHMIAYETIEDSAWVFIVTTDTRELYAEVNHDIGWLIGVVAGLVVAGTFGMTRLLQPLAGRVVLRTDELEQEITSQTAMLHTEIAERQRAEASLRESEQWLRLISMSLLDGIVITEQGRIVEANQALTDMLGRDAEQLVGSELLDIFAPASHDLVQDCIGHATATVQEATLLAYDDVPLPVEVVSHMLEYQGRMLSLTTVRDIRERKRAEAEYAALQQQIIDTQRATLHELSTPLIPITDHVVIMPLIGSIDSLRAQQVMATLLEGVSQQRAEVVILDITGVQVVDTQVANTFIRAARAVKLLGARVMMTGIKPQVAQTLVHLGVDLGDIDTRSSLQAGIASVLLRRYDDGWRTD